MWSVGRVGANTEGVLTVETIARIRRDGIVKVNRLEPGRKAS